jgi:hypothetical protein
MEHGENTSFKGSDEQTRPGRVRKRRKIQMGKLLGKLVLVGALLLPVAAHAATGGGGLPHKR